MKEVVNHINYPNSKGEIYCRSKHKIVDAGSNKFWSGCETCSLFSGDYQGLGVECSWEDSTENYSEYIDNPLDELLRVSKLIDKNVLKK